MSEERLLKIEEVAVLIGVSVKTINNWYWFKRENPESELAKLLPEYEQERPTSARLWKASTLEDFMTFKSSVKIGRNGAMGSVTQRYVKKEKNA